jgi:hypothetical protein
MIDNHTALVNALENILPTYYEMILKSGIDTPCISYMETNNYAITEPIGATVGYSRITYQVKVWGNDLEVLQGYAKQIDDALRVLGFKRISSRELYDNNSAMIQKILTYEALAFEEFK